MTSIIELIKKRVSWRKFEKKSLPLELRKQLIAFANSLTEGPFGNLLRPSLLTNQDQELYKSLGAYGVISGATDYFAAAISKGEGNLEDFGFLVEQVVLKATELGVGSCWLGGTFSKKSFAKAIDLQENEIVPAVIALGFPTSKRGMVDTIIRLGARSKTRKPFAQLFFNQDFKTPLRPSGVIGDVLEMVRLAPSASNQQPWRVIYDSQGFHFYIHRTDKYQKTLKRFKLFDLQRVDLGIALSHFYLASKELGFSGNFSKVGVELSDIPPNTEYVISWIL